MRKPTLIEPCVANVHAERPKGRRSGIIGCVGINRRHSLRVTLLAAWLLPGSLGIADDHNLVRGRRYDMWPRPAYSYCTDDGDRTQLTDGYTNYKSGRIWVDKTTVGWGLPLNQPAVILFDLGQPATLSQLRFYTTGGGGAGVVDVGLRVFVSLDNQRYVPAGERPPPPSPNQNTIRGIRMDVPLHGVRGRYVAVAAMAPAPYYFVFVDEIEILGAAAADRRSALPIAPGVAAGSAQELQAALAGGLGASQLMSSLLSPLAEQLACWPKTASAALTSRTEELKRSGVGDLRQYAGQRAAVTALHRTLARAVYGTDTLVWEVPPDDQLGLLSLPSAIRPPRTASIHTVLSALEATALGAANLTAAALPLEVSVAGGGPGAPTVTARVARFFATSTGIYVPDALLAADCPQTIPSGEARLVWLEAESTGARAGAYRYDVALRIGNRSHAVRLDVFVHAVTLSPDTPLCTGNWAYLNDGYPERKVAPVVKATREAMLTHRITLSACSMCLPLPRKDAGGNVIRPIQLDFKGLDGSLAFNRSFPQIAWYLAFSPWEETPSRDLFGKAPWMSDEYKNVFTEWLTKVVARIKAGGRGYDRFFFQFFDETLDPKVAQLARLVKSIDPRVRIMLTIPSAGAAATHEVAQSGIDIFDFHATGLLLAAKAGPDNVPDGLPVLRSGGRELWFYGAADSRLGEGRERDPLVFFRLIHWQAFRYGATGVGFWNMLSSPVSGWEDGAPGRPYWPQVYPAGAGFPPPPPDVKTSEIVVPSRRWEYQRMGIEDYMLLTMAQQRIHKLAALGGAGRQKLDRIVNDVLAAPGDRKLFRQKRGELIALLEELGK
jgi:hypothetical protein